MAVASLFPVDEEETHFVTHVFPGRDNMPVRPTLSRSPPSDLPKSASFSCLPTVAESDGSASISAPSIITDSSVEDLSAPSIDTSDPCPTDSSGWTTPSDELKITPDLSKELGVGLVRVVSGEDANPSNHKRTSSGSADADDELALAASPKSIVTGTHSQARPHTFLKTRRQPGQESKSSGLHHTSTKQSVQRSTSVIKKTLLQKSFSTDRLHGLSGPDSDARTLAALKGETYNKGAPFKPAFHKRRDVLWAEFRTLNEAYAKFSSKSMSFKAAVIRQSLLPFLSNTTSTIVDQDLRPEDLDRRINVLHKWWNALLELLHGKNSQSLSGTDRPAVLEGISGLMERSEWRAGYPQRPATKTHISDSTANARKSMISIASSSSDSSSDTVHVHVRTLFEQTLAKQMVFVTEKMSLRNASASLVTFCGQAIAYAFFFCPQMAEILVRQWSLTAEPLRRILRQYDALHIHNADDATSQVKTMFPPAIQALAFTSVSKTLQHLRRPVSSTQYTGALQMYGYWHERWLGRDSDLFYAFVRSFFVLTEQHLPLDNGPRNQIMAPAMLLVQSQLLTTLDSTINRDTVPQSECATNANSLDDFLAGPDAVVASLPLVPPNAFRLMSENRLIMLVRDALSDRSTDTLTSQRMFAASFHRILFASACSISIFSHQACYTLCDFLEEALVILHKYDQKASPGAPVLDLTRWTNVFEKMLESQNTVTEIRLYSLIYTIWPLLSHDNPSKEAFSLRFLLSPARFEHGFLHWCPMVRAYFMRLICWRLSRFDGSASDSDDHMLLQLRERLQTIWIYHQHSLDLARKGTTKIASARPCAPAPGRRLMIVRLENQPNTAKDLISFGGIAPTVTAPTSMAPETEPVYTDRGRPLSTASADSSDYGMAEPSNDSGLRSFIKSIMGSSARRSNSRRSQPGSANATPPNGLAASDTSSTSSTPGARPAMSRSATSTAQRPLSFKFSLEFVPRSHPNNWSTSADVHVLAPQLPLAGQRRVQALVGGKDQPASSSSGPANAGTKTTYAGRALSEWMQVVGELQHFLERRRAEGVPEDHLVETPTLAVEFGRR